MMEFGHCRALFRTLRLLREVAEARREMSGYEAELTCACNHSKADHETLRAALAPRRFPAWFAQRGRK